MMRVRERRPEQRIQAQVKAQKEAKLGRVKQGWKASRSGAKERTKRSGMRRRPYLSSLRNERQEAQKKDLTAEVLCYQYGGDSQSGLKPAGASDNWRCMAVENLSDLELLDGPWQTAENHSRTQNCIVEVEFE